MGILCCLTTANLLWVLKLIGFIKLLELIYRLKWFLSRQFRTTEHLTERYGKGTWAVVTGGSDGIGLAMCKELARREFNIVIVSRNMEKMRLAEAEIRKVKPQCLVQLVEFDFTKTKENHSVEEYQKGIVDKVADLDVSILINNAGFMVPGDFERVSIEDHKSMIDVGIMPATLITKLLGDKMLARKGRSAIMFVTSV